MQTGRAFALGRGSFATTIFDYHTFWGSHPSPLHFFTLNTRLAKRSPRLLNSAPAMRCRRFAAIVHKPRVTGSNPVAATSWISVMPIIQAEGLSKTYRVYQKQSGLLGAFRGLF